MREHAASDEPVASVRELIAKNGWSPRSEKKL
jgi:hypothetical protein